MGTHSTVEQVEGRLKGGPKGLANWSGLSLVALGVGVLVLNGFKGSLENWWALFILLPAFALFYGGRAINRRADGRLSFLARFNFAIGTLVLVVAVMFLINLDWSVWWPLMLMTPGFSMLIASGKNGQNPTVAAWIGYVRWLATTIIGLGFVFLANELGVINLESLGQFRWWSLFVALPAMGALWQAVRLSGRLGRISASAVTLLLLGLVNGATAVMELFGLSWEMWHGSWATVNGITAVLLIGIGVVLLGNGLRRQSE